ncbi:Alb1-domain-containing protein [Chaetomidium leptoderma]|uniref:Alb1-domain-containing protein n=1 Tax=Chaetomidium leptoderma TaxID=669021 RepID=A0AAN6VHE7_9PEZI|nr:Alb1-domain-containing protein [Chaetomidium leptoderma]
MAKGTITKGKRGPSLHSRASRRATSPSIDTDKSLKHVQPPQDSVDRRPAVLAAHHAGGVIKKTKTGRKAVPSFKARKRQERSMDRAEAIMDRTALKVQKSKVSAKVIESRKKTWDEVNREAFDREEQRKLGKKAKAKMDEDAVVAAFYADTDGDGDAEMMEEGAGDDEKENSGVAAAPVQAADETEEIL